MTDQRDQRGESDNRGECDRQASGIGRPAKLNRAVIVRTAIGLADRYGLEAVTMRAVAADLDSAAAALYRHVRNRDQLVDLIRDEVLAERAEVNPTGDRRADLRAFVLGLLDVHGEHPWLADGGLPASLGPRTLATVDEALALVASHPAGEGQKQSAVAVLFELVAGFARSGAATRSLAAQSLKTQSHAARSHAALSRTTQSAPEPEAVVRDHAIAVILAAVTGVLNADDLD